MRLCNQSELAGFYFVYTGSSLKFNQTRRGSLFSQNPHKVCVLKGSKGIHGSDQICGVIARNGNLDNICKRGTFAAQNLYLDTIWEDSWIWPHVWSQCFKWEFGQYMRKGLLIFSKPTQSLYLDTIWESSWIWPNLQSLLEMGIWTTYAKGAP